MKKSTILIIAGAAIVAVSLESNALVNQTRQEIKTSVKIEYPEDVKKIIDNKCYGCHNPESKSEKGKGKLDWTFLPGLVKAEQVSKLDKVIEVLDKGEMPPKRLIEREPGAKISEADAKILKDWAQSTSENLLK